MAKKYHGCEVESAQVRFLDVDCNLDFWMWIATWISGRGLQLGFPSAYTLWVSTGTVSRKQNQGRS